MFVNPNSYLSFTTRSESLLPFGVRRQPDIPVLGRRSADDGPLAPASRRARIRRRFEWEPAANQSAVAALRVERRTVDSRQTPWQ